MTFVSTGNLAHFEGLGEAPELFGFVDVPDFASECTVAVLGWYAGSSQRYSEEHVGVERDAPLQCRAWGADSWPARSFSFAPMHQHYDREARAHTPHTRFEATTV